MKRANWLPAPHFYNLNQACRLINEAFGDKYGCYLVGSCLHRRDYRDVDVRFIMDDAEFERLFPRAADTPYLNPLWSLMCTSFSLFLQKHSDLPVDFQIQQQTVANTQCSQKAGHERHPLGIFLHPNPRDYAADLATEEKP